MVEKNNAATNQPDMGATPHAKGVTFRVWAPHAVKVYVTGTFNGWNGTSTPLVSEQNGYPGTFESVIEKFPYLNKLGINAVEVMPITQFAGHFSWGYNPRAGLWKTRFNSDSYNYSLNFANHPVPDVEAYKEKIDSLPYSGKISIGPYTVAIFSQNE